jgi:hypothetical protein
LSTDCTTVHATEYSTIIAADHTANEHTDSVAWGNPNIAPEYPAVCEALRAAVDTTILTAIGAAVCDPKRCAFAAAHCSAL